MPYLAFCLLFSSTLPIHFRALEEAANAEEAAYAERDAAKAVAALRIVQTVVTVAATRTVCTKDNSQDTGNLPLGPVETVLRQMFIAFTYICKLFVKPFFFSQMLILFNLLLVKI